MTEALSYVRHSVHGPGRITHFSTLKRYIRLPVVTSSLALNSIAYNQIALDRLRCYPAIACNRRRVVVVHRRGAACARALVSIVACVYRRCACVWMASAAARVQPAIQLAGRAYRIA